MKALNLFCVMAVLSATAASAAPMKIGVLLKDRDLFWATAEKGALAAGQAAGVELIIKAPLVPNALGQQQTMLAALAKEPLDALVIAALTADDLKEPLAALAAKGVKIVVLETRLPDGIGQTYLGYNQAHMAEDAARFFAGLVHEGDKAAMLRAISIEASVDGMTVRERTLVTTFKKLQPKVPLYSDVVVGSERQDDYAKSLLLFERHPDIRAVCTPFSASSMAMIRALKDKGLAGKVIHVGFGSSLPDSVVAAIESGAMQGWIAQQPRLFGSKGVEAAIDLVRGKPVPATIEVPYFIVTPANLKDPQVQALRN
jgi:ribose transport system substrate-binding protein